MKLYLNKNQLFITSSANSGLNLKNFVKKETGLHCEEFYLIFNGKLVSDEAVIENGKVHVVLRCLGGKGGFGSMLRAIGAQIEKTTNREACRDLSGRRLRDINEEKRLKNWINQQAEREKEAKERKQKKLERLCERPRHEFKDEQYDRERSDLPEIVENAVIQGMQASTSSKRKVADKSNDSKKKKAKLWVDEDLDDDLSSGSDEESETEEASKKLQEKSQKSTADSDDSQSSSPSEKSLTSKDNEHPQSTEQSSKASTNDLQIEKEETSVQKEEKDENTAAIQSTG